MYPAQGNGRMNQTQPNIIFIITDQQRYDTINALGFPYMDTPAVDRLVREGTVFTQCHVAGASCAPSRGALFTGYYPHTTGIFRNGSLWRRTWLESFAAAGYYTVNIGKMHTEPMDTPAGFHERYVVENKERSRKVPGVNQDFLDKWDVALGLRGYNRPSNRSYGVLPDFDQRLGAFEWPWEPELHSDNFVGDLALWWLRRKPINQPLFVQIGFPGPHPPYDPLEEETRAYMDRDLPILPVTQEEMDRQPPTIDALRKMHMEVEPDSAVHRPHASMEDRKRQRAYYLANQTMIDRKIDEILVQLEELGYLENAIVVFTSDHGDCLGDHGLNQKWNCYEQITRVPLVIWGPGRVPAGNSVDAMIQQQDIVSWLMEMAGVPVPETLESQSVGGAFNGGNFTGRDAVFCEQGKDRMMQADFMTMVRTADWKLVHFLNEDFGQLFDLGNDPHELNDLWDDPGAASIKREMIDRLFHWRMESQNHTSDWAEEAR